MSRTGFTILTVALLAVDSFVHAQGQPQAPQPLAQRAPDALERVTWRTRTLVGDDRLTRWKFAVPANGVAVPTFLDAVVRADAAIVDFVEGSNGQKASPDIQKNFDWNLTPQEIAALRGRMGTVKMLTYRVDDFPRDADSQRKLFEFARAMGTETLVTNAKLELSSPAQLADEFGINVAVLSQEARPVELMKTLQSASKRVGIGIDTGVWAADGVSPRDGLALVKDRLMYVKLRDRTRGTAGRHTLLGRGAANLIDLFNELNRLNVRPLALTLDTSGVMNAPADLFAAVDAFETVVQPAYGAHFTAFSKTRPIRWDLVTPARGETLTTEEIAKRSDEVRRKIEAAIPRQAYATPKKRRKLLVIESLHGMSHSTIPHTNVMVERMGTITGAWETEFSNDLDNLKYPKIKQYDGVFLNDIVGEFAAEPAVRDGLARFVREGGGMAGIHGTPWASRNWDEFAEMIGAQSAPHRIEQGIMKVYDRASPIMKPFQEKDLNFKEEYYRFQTEGQGRLRWDKVRVLMTVELDDPKIEPRPWTGYKRPDNVYPVSWIRNYGKGHVFYSSLGHMPETFMTPELVGHFLAGLQFMLGDLEADATPNPHRD
jgi:type 1 glutamine amidotransferase/sugar phosphate isomerase/epimerase